MKFFYLLLLLSLCKTRICGDQLLVFKDELFYNERDYTCISENPLDAVIWNTNLISTTEIFNAEQSKFSLSIKQPDNLRINIAFAEGINVFFNSWRQETGNKWISVPSIEKPMGPVFDTRWEDFREYNNMHSKLRGARHLTDVQETGALAVSIRAVNNADLHLCATTNSNNYCYNIVFKSAIKESYVSIVKCSKMPAYNSSHEISKCDTEVLKKLPYNLLSAYEWRTFIIKWQGTSGIVQLYDLNENLLDYTDPKLTFSDTNKLHYQFSIYFGHSEYAETTLYRFHLYNYLLTNQSEAVIYSRTLRFSPDICINMLVGLCSECALQVYLKHRFGEILLSLNNFNGETIHGLLPWQQVQAKISELEPHLFPAQLKIVSGLTNTNSSYGNYHWAIASIQECLKEGTYKTAVLRQSQDVFQRDMYLWPKVTCQKLSFGEEGRLLVDASHLERVKFDSFQLFNGFHIDFCNENNSTSNCRTSFMSYYTWDCKYVVMCAEEGCSCSKRTGACYDDCRARSENYYGFGCRKQCDTLNRDVGVNTNYCNLPSSECTKCEGLGRVSLKKPYCDEDSLKFQNHPVEESKPLQVPQNFLTNNIGNGIIDLTWNFALTKKDPTTGFNIIWKRLESFLEKSLAQQEIISSITVPVGRSTDKYYLRLYLLPSTTYYIEIQGITQFAAEKKTDLLITTQAAFAFVVEPTYTTNRKNLQIHVFIPPLVNATKFNPIRIVVIGPRPCKEVERVNFHLAADLRLDVDDFAWEVANSEARLITGQNFTIGTNQLHNDVPDCPLLMETYIVAILVYDRDETNATIVRKSKPIHFGSMPAALAFVFDPIYTINYKDLQIHIFIPPLVNAINFNLIHIVVIGPRPCKEVERVNSHLAADLRLEVSDFAWKVATFDAQNITDKNFTIGDNQLYNYVPNCPLLMESYIVAILVYDRDKKSAIIVWQSESIDFGLTQSVDHKIWAIPLVIFLGLLFAIIFYFSRKRIMQRSLPNVDNYYDDVGTLQKQHTKLNFRRN